MTFKAYDIFSSLVPGFLLLIGLQVFFEVPYDNEYVVAYTAVAFFFGYIANTLGSWLENFYFLTWGGKPSTKLLSGKGIWKVKIYNSEKLLESLKTKADKDSACTDELFDVAMRYSHGENGTRIGDFIAKYAFTRTLFTVSLIVGTLILIKYYTDWRCYAFLLLVFTLWLRCKQQGYFYAKEVLNVYSKINNL